MCVAGVRADARLLEKHAREIVGRLPMPIQVAELGSGTGKKTRWILEALSRRQKTYYYPIEISPSALAALKAKSRWDNNMFFAVARALPGSTASFSPYRCPAPPLELA